MTNNTTVRTRRMAGLSILTALVIVLQIVATFVKIGNRWCCMKAMEDIDFVCQNDGYNVW